MTAGLVQLISSGTIDGFVTINPETTFFRSVFKRHTNFAIETYEELFSSVCGFGGMSECRINKYGDLITDMILKIELPSLNETHFQKRPDVCTKSICDCYCDACHKDTKKTVFSWTNAIGHVMIEYVELQIGGRVYVKHPGDWFEVWTEYSQPNEKRPGYYEMIGKKEPTGFNHTSFNGTMSLVVPLNFWFCRSIGDALPIISMQHDDIVVRVKWRDFNDCYMSNIPNAKPKMVNNFSASIYVDYVYLDVVERNKFIVEPQIYIIEQLQNYDFNFSKAVKSPKMDLSVIKYPVKELIWALQRDDVGISDETNYGNDWYNYGINKNRLISNKNGTNDTFMSARLVMDGMERFKDTKSTIFRLVKPYKLHTRIPANYLYCYSFALKPEELRPTGCCNFSIYSNVSLQLNNVQIPCDYVVKLWATNLNIVLVTNGRAGIAEM